jgi:hypothetical protein
MPIRKREAMITTAFLFLEVCNETFLQQIEHLVVCDDGSSLWFYVNHYARVRKRLQRKGTRSATRRLKAHESRQQEIWP